MKKLILPLVLGIVGLGIGAGAGYFLRGDAQDEATKEEEEPALPPEYAKLSNQFVIPVMDDGTVVSLVVLSLSLEVTQGSSELVFQNEPKLRDEFLQVLFSHANSGGFRGSFTDAANLVPLRMALFEAASVVMPGVVTDVLIGDIVRQDG